MVLSPQLIMIASIVASVIVVFILTYILKKTKPTEEQYKNTFVKSRSVEFSPLAIITISIKGFIISWNRAAEIMFDLKESEMIGQTLTPVIPEQFRKLYAEYLTNLELSGENIGKTFYTTALKKIDEEGRTEEFPIELTIWRWIDNEVVYYTGIARNITKEKKEDELFEDEYQLYKRGEEIENSGVCHWDLVKDIVTSTPGFKKIFSVGSFENVNSEYFLRKIHSEDIENVKSELKIAIDRGQGYNLTFRLLTPQGGIIWIRNISAPNFNENGILISFDVAVQEVKENI